MNNEPVAWIDEINTFVLDKDYKQFPKNLQNGMIPLYTHPAKTLTDEEIEGIARANVDGHSSMEQFKWFARAILKKASEK
jgi:hypothetical protein